MESSHNGSHMTTTNHDFTLSSSSSITTLGSSSSTPLSRRHSVYPHLCHRIGGTSTYNLEKYSVGCVLGMIRDDKGE